VASGVRDLVMHRNGQRETVLYQHARDVLSLRRDYDHGTPHRTNDNVCGIMIVAILYLPKHLWNRMTRHRTLVRSARSGSGAQSECYASEERLCHLGSAAAERETYLVISSLARGWGHQIRQGEKRIYDGGEDKNDND
jgi:hypothetical protein